RSYKATDTLVSAVRVGNYQGRVRLVVDLTSAEVPQFSVDSSDTLLTAFIGEKNESNKSAEHSAQVLFLANEARNGHNPQSVPGVAADRALASQTKPDIRSVAANDVTHHIKEEPGTDEPVAAVPSQPIPV